jgi:hypothetical protein
MSDHELEIAYLCARFAGGFVAAKGECIVRVRFRNPRSDGSANTDPIDTEAVSDMSYADTSVLSEDPGSDGPDVIMAAMQRNPAFANRIIHSVVVFVCMGGCATDLKSEGAEEFE